MAPRIVFVDDDLPTLHSIRRGMRAHAGDWEVHFAQSAPDALQHMATAPVDAIVTDLRMPGMSGDELSREVVLRYPWVIRIIFSGMVDAASVAKGSQWSERYVTKPCPLPSLLAEIARAMLSRDQDRALVPLNALATSSVPTVLFIGNPHPHGDLVQRAFAQSVSGVALVTVPHAKAALEYLAQRSPYLGAPRPDVILYDANMTAQDLEFICRYRADTGTIAPIMVLLPPDQMPNHHDVLRHGASTVLEAPHTWEGYLDLARAAVRYANLVASRGSFP